MALLSPREGLSRNEFNDYWLRRHGPRVARTPGYGRYRIHYSQDHVQAQGPWGRPFGYAGLAQVRAPATAEVPTSFSETRQFRDRILPDEQKFLNRQTSVAFALDQVQLRPGRGAHKVVMLSAPGFGLGTDEIRFEVPAALPAPSRRKSAFGRPSDRLDRRFRHHPASQHGRDPNQHSRILRLC